MKKTAKKFLSLLLTVALLMGSIALMIPATILSVVADDYTNVTPNTDFDYNGETYRLDVYSGNTESYAHINADGSIEFKIRHGDMIWFPAVQMTETSAVHAEIKSVSSMANFFSGFTYGVKPAAAGAHWATTMGAVVCTGNATQSRTRVTAGSYANLGNVSGSDRGNGGDQRVNAAHWVNKSNAWTNVATSSGVWDAGKMITFDVTRSGNNVTVAFGSDWGTYDTISYDTTGHSTYAYEGGSVGFAPFWAGTDAYITLTIERLYVTNCTVNGDATDVWSAVGTPILPNADRTINGTTYRFDVVSGHTQSQAFINLDGSITFRISCGDMLWFPGIQMNGDATGTSEIHADITSLVNSTLNFTGLMYGISADGSGRWNYATEALVRTATRFRIANASYSTLSSNGGSAGSNVYNDQSNQSAIRATLGWKSVSNAAGTDWGDGKTIGFDVVKTNTTVKVSFMSREADKIYAHDGYTFNSTYPYAGSVGYGLAWVAYNSANSMSYSTLRMDRLTVKNCTVNDEQKDGTYTVVSRAVTATQKTIVAGQNMLNEINAGYFHGPAHPYSVAKINPDGTVTMRGWRGDMLWFPNVEIDDESTIHTEILLENDNTVDSSKVCMSTVWNIQTATPGVWGDNSDSCSVASLRTNSRVTVGSTTKSSSYESADYTGAYHNDNSTYDTYDANSDFGSSWTAGKILTVDISKTGDTVTVTFTNGSNDTLIVEKTYDDSERNTYKGAVGIMSHWNDGFNLFTIQAFTVTNALVNGERRDFNMVSEFASYMSDDFTVRQNLSLDGTIGLNFRLDANFNMPENATLVFSKNGEELYNGAASRYYRGDLGYYRYSVPVFAKEMADSATYNLKIKDGETVIFSQNYTTSVKSYADALVASDPSWESLMNAMLQYGAAAQELFGYNTNNLPASTSGITYDASSAPSLAIDASCSSFISEVLGTLTLESGTDLNLYVLPKNTNTFTATATNGSDSVDVTVEKAFDAKNSSAYYWKITINDLKAEELGDEFYITVSDGTHSVTFTYSALCWVKSAINSSQSTAATKTLAKAVGVYASEAQKKSNKTVDSLAGMVAGAGAVSALRATTDSRITSIRNSSNDTSLVWTESRDYYVSSSTGSDSNSGTDEKHPWKTLAKVNAKLNNKGSTYKYNIYLKRGDTWRGEYLKTNKTSNVTITTYGSGAKPIIMGSPENGANASKWTQVETNIWRYAGSDSWADVGNIVFNNGESFGRKVVQLYVKNTGLTDFTHPTAGVQSVEFSSYTDLKNDLDFYHDKDLSGGSGATGYLYLYSTSNPGSRFSSIEFAVDQHGIEIYKADTVRVDNICVKYVGGHGIAGQGNNLQNILVQNCEFGWIGGSIQRRISNSVIGTSDAAYDLRYGNGVEIYGGCNNFRVQNNYIYQCYDAGITQQYNCNSETDSDHTANQLNIYYHNNVIENCNYSIEYFISNCPTGNSSYINNFQITNNLMWNAGKGFCETRGGWERGFSAHVKAQSGSSSCNRFANTANAFVISGNKFIGERDAVFAICSKMSASNTNANPVITNNEIYGIYQTNTIGAVCNYNSGSDVKIHNVYAPFDKNIQTYMNTQIGSSKFSGNTIKFLISF